MGKVTFDLSMSLDGFITGPNDTPEEGLGVGGERLHEWLYDLESFESLHHREGGEQNRDSEILEESFRDVGGVVIGRRMYDNAVDQWGENPPFPGPVRIVTHRPQDPIVKSKTTYNFVHGIEAALDQARADAGGKDVAIAGGADVIQQYLRAGLVDDFQIHVAPILLGAGRRLFENLGDEPPQIEIARVVESPRVTHIKYRVVK